jgi:hypothetical protein
MKLTQEKIQILRDSIDAAKSQGACEYLDPYYPDAAEPKPSCVVGQAAIRIGISVAAIRLWNQDRVDSYQHAQSPSPIMRKHFPLDLLVALQEEWDRSGSGEEYARREMHRILNRWIADEFVSQQQTTPALATATN